MKEKQHLRRIFIHLTHMKNFSSHHTEYLARKKMAMASVILYSMPQNLKLKKYLKLLKV